MRSVCGRWIPRAALAALTLVVASGGAWAGLDFPFTTATQAEFFPGDTAVILGYEFDPGLEVMVKITRPDGSVQNAAGQANKADTVTTDSYGQFSYEYPQLNMDGYYWVEIIDAATLGRGRDKLNGTVLATTVFRDNIKTDLELVGQPDAQCGANRPPAHGSSPPTPSHGHDGLVDALASRCLVGTVDVEASGNDDDVRGFFFDLDIDITSHHQGPGNAELPFIDWLETVTIANAPDPDVGSSQADDGQGGCASNCYYTTGGATPMIPDDGTAFLWQALDGTWFQIQRIGPGNMVGEDRYRVTVMGAGGGNPDPLTDVRFEYCARINPNAGDADLGTDGFITSDPETGGTEASPINICNIEDQTPPICILTVVDCGVEVFISDPESGITSIDVLELINGTVDISPTPPTADDVMVIGTKIDCDLPGNLELEIINGAGLTTFCDPVDFSLIRGNGPPLNWEFPLNDREGYLHIENEGLSQIFIEMNGHNLKFTTTGGGGPWTYSMPENGTQDYDLTEYLVPGDNSVEIRAVGQPNNRARIVIHDVEP